MHAKTLYASPLVSIADVSCRPDHAGCGEEECTAGHKVVFPRSGVFVKHVGGARVVVDPTQVLFFNAHEPYRVSHPVPGGDDCTTFAFDRALLVEALAERDPTVAETPDRLFDLTSSLVEPRALLAERALRHRLKTGAADALEVEERALALLDAVVRGARGRAMPERVRRPRNTAHLRRERIEAAKLLLAGRPEAALGLGDLARGVNSSPYHLARLFRERVGLPVHQYRLRVRLALALERLLDGPGSLLTLALDLGFASHSHFSEAFRRLFGTTPQAFRAAASGRRFREMRKIPTA